MQKIIGLDMDDVCFDWVGKLKKLAQEEIPDMDFFHRDKQSHWNFSSNYPEAIRRQIDEIWHRPGFYRDLEIIPGAKEAYHFLIENDFKVFFVSSPNGGIDAGHCLKEKFESLEEHFGLDATRGLVLTYDKTLIRCDYLIDDKPQILGSHQPVFKHYVFDRNYPYNAHLPEEVKVNWENFKKIF